MKVKYIGTEGSLLSVLPEKIYECIGKEHERLRIIDETNEDYLHPAELFIIIGE